MTVTIVKTGSTLARTKGIYTPRTNLLTTFATIKHYLAACTLLEIVDFAAGIVVTTYHGRFSPNMVIFWVETRLQYIYAREGLLIHRQNTT